MKRLFTLILILTSSLLLAQTPKIKLLQINSSWNLKNDLSNKVLPDTYMAYEIQIDHATLEHQSEHFQKGFAGKPLPILVLIIDGKRKYQWTADLSFKLRVTRKEIIDAIERSL